MLYFEQVIPDWGVIESVFHSPYDPLMEVFFFDQFLPKTITLLQFLPPFTKETNIHFLDVFNAQTTMFFAFVNDLPS